MNFLLPYRSYLKENSFGAFDNSVFDYKENVYIDGYWQNKKYFEVIILFIYQLAIQMHFQMP